MLRYLFVQDLVASSTIKVGKVATVNIFAKHQMLPAVSTAFILVHQQGFLLLQEGLQEHNKNIKGIN
eukprot:1961299-Amphidinium_carterae.1